MSEKKQIETPRGNVAYWISGEENTKVLFFCHGLTADHTLFFHQEKQFKKKYCVICMDTPLHGASRPYTDFSFDHVAEDMNQILIKEGRKKAFLIGQSLGGYNCQVFYMKYPEKVEGFVAIDSTPLGDCYTSKMDRFILRHSKGVTMCYPRKMLIDSSSKAACYTKEAQKSFKDSLQQYTKKELNTMYGDCYKAVLKYHDPVKMKCPVLLILGDNDKAGKVTYYNKLWNQREKYPLKMVKNAGHNSNYDNYEAVNKLIEAFVRKSNH